MPAMKKPVNNYPHSTKIRFTKNNFQKIRKIKYNTQASFNKIINALIFQTEEIHVLAALVNWSRRNG